MAVFPQPVAAARSGTVRIICLREWNADHFKREQRPGVIPDAILDVAIPLSEISADTTASAVLAEAERRVGRSRYDFTNRVLCFRWLEGVGVLRRVGNSTLGKASLSLMEQVEDGDILVFFGPVERW